MTIRLATQADEPDIQRVIKSVYDEYRFSWDPGDYHADLYNIQGSYFDAGHYFWVAEIDGKVSGTVALELFEQITGALGSTLNRAGDLTRLCGCDCSLERLYVEPGARKLGIGRALVDGVIREAMNHNREAMEIWSDKRFVDAHRLYGKFGATVVSDRVCDDPDKSEEWGLVLRL